MVLCMDHNNADYLIKLTLSSRGKHILWVQIQNSDALSIDGARRTCADAPLGYGSVLDALVASDQTRETCETEDFFVNVFVL